MTFKELILCAKKGEQFALTELVNMYQPLLRSKAIVDGCFDEDLYQELCIVLIKCVDLFRVE